MLVHDVTTISELETVDLTHKLKVSNRFVHLVGHVGGVTLGVVDGLVESCNSSARRGPDHPLRRQLSQQTQCPLPVMPASGITMFPSGFKELRSRTSRP